MCRLGHLAGDPPRRRRALPGATRRRARRGGRRGSPPARLGVLARRPPDRERRVAVRRPLLVPPGGGGAAEPPGLALRAPLLAARRGCRERVGLRPARPALVRPRRRDGVLVAACSRSVPLGRARRRRRVLPDALPGRSVDRAPPRADLIPPPRDAARARAAPVRGGCCLPRGDPALRPAPPRARGDPARARIRVGAYAAGLLVEGGGGLGRRARRGPGRRPLGRRGLDRHRPLVRPGGPVLGGGLGLRHARCGERGRGAGVLRVADAARGDRGVGRGPAPPWPRPPARAGRAPPLPPRPRCQPAGLRDPLASRAGARRDAGARAVHAHRVPRARRPRRLRGGRRPDSACVGSPQARLAGRRRGCLCAAGGRSAGPGVRRRRGRYAERRIRGDPREGTAARASRLPAGRPLRQRLPGLCPSEPARASAGVLDHRAEACRRAGARAPPPLLRPRNGARRPRHPLRRRAPRRSTRKAASSPPTARPGRRRCSGRGAGVSSRATARSRRTLVSPARVGSSRRARRRRAGRSRSGRPRRGHGR